ncbi:MOSC domain-containing protein [Mucilaginibacter sp. Bleaf8]|uniref:MOSC domain-containing protein n=1 Tax=Mucilaginibacter sp. Bleaf8 TaxID=2834430 RepID=UPI001BCD0564|nr:MOSC domain-containing protein [Mucilaginibacter sp. Bleaf8]MBS7563597.1 MOSC domain-containing protein [Mucilaginibacter sp. Bleaf8]
MKLTKSSPLQKLLDTLPQQGKVCWIGIRPQRKAPLLSLNEVEALTLKGLAGDHFSGSAGSKRQVTLIQQEHLDAIASIMQLPDLSPGIIRRNIVVKGINLLALKDKTFWVGNTLLEYTGECHPCSRMEENLGAGGYNAVRGHGGITARILQGGIISVGDAVKMNGIDERLPATDLFTGL